MTMAIRDYPRCAAYVKAMNCRLDDPEMTEYHWAIVASEAFTDDELVKLGTISFETMQGGELLAEFERLLATRTRGRHAKRNANKGMESLTAFLGSRGVKTSALHSDDDFWTAATTLWPRHVKRDGDLSSLLSQIKAMTKRERREATANFAKLPADWRASQ